MRMKLKRIFDIIASILGMIITIPLYIVIPVLIKILMPGPVFFRQIRVGRGGKRFRLVKFRTMKVNHGGNNISVKGESRITPLGAWLRRYKLDEFPEFWNILKGDMSFVGPRPDVPGNADTLEGEDRLLLTVRPGLTGAASLKYIHEEELLAMQADPVKFNNEVIYPDKVRIELNYIRNWSFLLDIKIILFTLAGKNLGEHWSG